LPNGHAVSFIYRSSRISAINEATNHGRIIFDESDGAVNNVASENIERQCRQAEQPKRMAKDPTDSSTLDFIAPALHVTCGQVLMDRQRHIAIVAKRGTTSAHLVRVKSGTLKLTKLTAKELVEEWSDADYPFERAVAKLLELGKQHGITDSARLALEKLLKTGREPTQQNLFG
jgi:hypothetical protein